MVGRFAHSILLLLLTQDWDTSGSLVWIPGPLLEDWSLGTSWLSLSHRQDLSQFSSSLDKKKKGENIPSCSLPVVNELFPDYSSCWSMSYSQTTVGMGTILTVCAYPQDNISELGFGVHVWRGCLLLVLFWCRVRGQAEQKEGCALPLNYIPSISICLKSALFKLQRWNLIKKKQCWNINEPPMCLS